jgi:RNA polymerase sigma-70 factor (ECF subfamily)
VTETDAALVERGLSGDESGLRALLERFQGAVFGLCYRMLSHREDAEDVTQEVFLRAFRSLSSWDAARPFKPWLLTIAANRCRTFLQNRSRMPAATEFAAETADEDPGPSDLGEELQLALDELRDDYRLCFTLFYQQELSVAEVADVMKCAQGTVKTWLHRARHQLAEFLERRGVVPDVHLSNTHDASNSNAVPMR